MTYRRKWQCNFPVALPVDPVHFIARTFLPFVEGTDEVNFCSVGCPFPEDPLFIVTVKTIKEVSHRKINKRSVHRQTPFLLMAAVIAAVNGIREWLQPWIG